jgi:translation initiation factor IF-3
MIADDGSQVGVMSALRRARARSVAELDLVEVSPTAEPPVCRIMDYRKFLFEQNKKAHAAKRSRSRSRSRK